jgi:serine/threonine protein kinase
MPTLDKGQIFERYRIMQWLGSGVSGESYEAEDTMLLRKVTLKLIHPAATLPDAARRQFFREMLGISILSHPYITPVLDYGEIDGKLYVARRYINNGSLLGYNGRLWYRTPLAALDAIQYGHQLAQALQFIHNRGYVHGALTFANILVSCGPKLKRESDDAPFLLTDVGLTNFIRRFVEQDGLTLPMPITAAPEQLNKRVLQASDQYALAVVLYFWLVGHPPFTGSPKEIEQLKLAETITPLSSFNPNITVEQDGVVLRALSASPEDRYHSVLAFTNALLATLPSSPQPEPETEAENLTAETIKLSSKAVLQSLAESISGSLPTAQITDLHEQLTEKPSENASMSAYVVIISPYNQKPSQVELDDEEMTIGRAGSSNIFLDRDDLTSRHHALLKHENNSYVIYDRRSSNGVQVNGQTLQGENGYALADGDHISIGNYELIFRLGLPEATDQEDPKLVSQNDTTIRGAW